jgi:hypothetical protein
MIYKMAETKTKTVVKGNVVVLKSEWKEFTLQPTERLPITFLESKLREDQKYIPIGVYRDIMRQIWEFWIPTFADAEKIITGKNKSWWESIAFKVKVEVVRNKPWVKEPILLKGSWYSAMTWGIMLSEAIHWNFKTLEAKALRDALKYSYLIFEHPEADVEEPTEDKDMMINKIIEEAVWPAPTKEEAAEKKATKDDIQKDFDTEMQAYNTKVLAWWPEAKAEKWDILAIATKLKEKYWVENKKIILEIITQTLNDAQ